MANTPVQPLISNLDVTTLTITAGADGNPGTTHYIFRVITGSTTKYLTAGGVLQDTAVYINQTVVNALGLTSNTTYSISLSAADDALGTGATVYGPAAAAVTLVAPPASPGFSTVYSTTGTFAWLANNNPDGTEYYAEISPDAGFLTGVQNSGWVTTLSHIFTSLSPSTTYYGRVKARNSSLVETAYTSAVSSATTTSGPGTVRGLHVYNLIAERGFLLKWGGNIESDVVSYNVYRSSSPTDPAAFNLLGTVPAAVTSYIDNVPYTFGLVWYYKIGAVDAGGNESDLLQTTPVHDNTFHSFEEQPFPTVIMSTDFVTGETPSGTIDGANTLFTVTAPYRKDTTAVYVDGLKKIRGTDYTEGPLSQQLTFTTAPTGGSAIQVDYIKFV